MYLNITPTDMAVLLHNECSYFWYFKSILSVSIEGLVIEYLYKVFLTQVKDPNTSLVTRNIQNPTNHSTL